MKFNGAMVIFGIAGFVYAIYTNCKMNQICETIDKKVDEISDEMEVDIPESIIDQAVEKAVAREVAAAVKTATQRVITEVEKDIHEEVRTTVRSVYSDLKPAISREVKRQIGDTVSTGPQGPKGDTGATGATGVFLKSITNYYLATASSSGVTASTSGWTTSVQSVSASKKYLWNYEKLTYTDNSTASTAPCIIGAYGDMRAKSAIDFWLIFATILKPFRRSTNQSRKP